MANTLINLVPDLYAALDIVSRELVGFVPAVARNSGAERAAVGQAVRVPIAPEGNVSDITPAMTVPSPTDQSIGNVSITISKARAAEFGFVGEEQRGLNNGAGYATVQAGMIAQAMRKLVNEVEADLAALYYKGSRAYGTAATTPFASDLSDTANIGKILSDNGAPLFERNLVINTTAGAKLRTLGQLTKANEAGSIDLLRQGVIAEPVQGLRIRESAAVKAHTKGTGSGYVTNLEATLAEGSVTIACDTGSGTILAGDVVTFAGDTNKYIVTTALSGGSFTIAAPGLRQTLADGVAITVGNSYSANFAFDTNAIQLVTRAPALPAEGDIALDRMMITDPLSGLSFEVSIYGGYRKVRYELALAWGVQVIKPEHTAILLG